MDSENIEEIIASANGLLASVYRDFNIVPPSERRNRASALTVSPDAQRQLNNIDRALQEITEEAEEASEITATNEESVQIVASTIGRVTPSSRRNGLAEVEVIDLCFDSPENNGRRLRNARQILVNEVVDLVSPRSSLPSRNTQRRRSALAAQSNGPPDKQSRSSENTDAEKSLHSQMVCAICMETYTFRQPTTTKCGHIFCGSCIKQSIQVKSNCPICRTKLNRNSLIRIHF